MSDSSERYGGAEIIELTGKITVLAIVLLLFVLVFVFCLHLYAKHFWHRRRENPNSTSTDTGRRRLDFASGHHEIPVSRRGLEPSLLKTLPILIFDPKQFKDGLDCAVCLSDISQGEKARLLPKCNHGFHLDCIDMWFESHSTCPLCRNPVKTQSSGDEQPPEAAIVAEIPAESPNFPTNVFIWGDETQISTSTPPVEENNHDQANNTIIIVVEPSSSSSSSSSSMLPTSSTPDGVISTADIIPRQINEDAEQKPTVSTRLRTLKRLLSYNNRRVNPSSSRNLDLEQGSRGQS